MIRRTIAAGAATSVAAALLVPWGVAANAADTALGDLKPAKASSTKSLKKGTVLELGTGTKPETYIVQLDAPAVPTRDQAEGPRLTAAAESESAYRKEIRADQSDLVSSISDVTGSPAKVLFRYTEALNGVAVQLTRAQAQKVSRIDGVAAVQVDFERELTTDRGPGWIGADTIWDGSNVPPAFEGNQGEGVVVGILDSGLNPANPSFAAMVPEEEGGDGVTIENPLGAGNYLGMCDPESDQYVADWGCNDKLIGYYNFENPASGGDPFDDPYDDDGHGSHTGSTTAGNQVEATAYAEGGDFEITRTIRGVAPHANVIGYDVCDGGCQGYSILASINQAITDGVDVINYSIGSSAPSNPWTDADAVAFLNARAAGIHVATSAGNDGPGAATLGSPGDVPWMTTVGATTHDRKYISSVVDIVATDAATLDDIEGAGLSGPTDGSFPIVWAGDFGNALCGAPSDAPPGTGTTFPAGTDFTGKIVLCDRGGNGRVEKGTNVAALNAEGMILANNQASGNSLNGDAHDLPTAHISYADGQALRAFMAAHPGTEAALSGAVEDIRDENGDIMAAFSSRGPNRSVSSISPSVSAPGVDILAAAGDSNEVVWEFISGTSMASPHTAGALALLKGMQLGLDDADQWSPAEAQSALMTTAERDITDSDGTAADWFDMGSGRIELRRAAKAGLVLDETRTDYLAANPAAGGDVRALNTASMADDECLQTCSWTRTFTGTDTGVGTWDVSVEDLSEGVTLETDVDTITIDSVGDTASVTVTATIDAGVPTNKWLFGTLVLTPPAESADTPVAHLPVGVLPSAGVLPTSIDITTRRDAGSQVTEDLEAIAISDLQIDASGLVPEDRTSLSVVEDSTNTDPYDGNGVQVEEIEVPAGATSLIAKLENPTAPDFDLYVGTGAVSEANVVAFSASGGSDESVVIADPEPGTYWVLVQNWEASAAGGTDTTDLVTAVVAGDQGNLRAEGPDGPVEAATPFSIRTFWDESELDAGEVWHGTLTLGTSAATPGDIGVVPVTLTRVDDDVTKSADVTEAAPGDTITYTVEVAPNVSQADLTYSITDALPEGTTYVEGSATDGATFADGVVSWSGSLESTFGEEGNYTLTTSAQDASCTTPFGPGYLDLASLPQAFAPDPDFVGDTEGFTVSADGTFPFYGVDYEGVTFTDDGFLVYGNGYAGRPWAPQAVPDALAPNNVAAMLWQDMELRYDADAGSGITSVLTGTDPGDVTVVEYDDMRLYDDEAGAGGSLDMEVFAVAGSNDLYFAYDNITPGAVTGGDPDFPVTIGTENADGSVAASLVNQGDASDVLEDGLVVCATYSEPEAEGASFSYQVTVDPTVGEKDLTNTVVHTTDDPGAKPVSAKHTVKIKGAAVSTNVALSLDPTSIQTGGTTAATAQVFSTGPAAPTGTVEFWAGTRLAGTGTLDASGRATATLSGFTTAGTVPVTAKYLGDAASAAATSAPVNLVVTAPGQPAPKVKSKIDVDAPKTIKKGKKALLRIAVSAPKVVPTGTVEVTVKGALKKKTWTLTLNEYGKVRLRLPKAKELGKIKVKVEYLGDAAVLGSKEKLKIRVVRK